LRAQFPLADPNYLALYLSLGLLASIALLHLDVSPAVKRWAGVYAIITPCGCWSWPSALASCCCSSRGAKAVGARL
jgi:hypothetical protein